MKDELCLTGKMLEALSSLKGRTLKSYEADLGGMTGEVASDVVIFNTASLRVPVFRVEEEHRLFGELVEAAPLECFALDPARPYHYAFEDDAKLYLVGERVRSVEVVRDTGTWDEDGEERTLVEDQAIIVRTSGHAIGVSLYAFEEVRVRVADSPDAEVGDVAAEAGESFQMWGDVVKREVIEL